MNVRDATFAAPASPPPSAAPAAVAAALERHGRALTILLAGHHLRQINRLHTAFAGDLVQPIVLGEVAVLHMREALADDMGLAPPAARAVRRPQLARASGMPRETVRRAVRRLMDGGWLHEPAPRQVALTGRALELFGPEGSRAQLDDLLWTGDRVAEVVAYRDDAAARLALRADLMNALATRAEDMAAPLFSTQFVPPAAPGITSEREPHAIAIALTEYWLAHLYRLQEAFDGDLIAALLLGEVAHFNVASLAYRRSVGLATLDAFFIDAAADEARAIMRPCNAHSLSLVTHVPDTSVRRKLRALVERGWLDVQRDGYVVNGRVGPAFAAFNARTLQSFLDTERRVRRLLGPRPA